jgi:hypothetical protein
MGRAYWIKKFFRVTLLVFAVLMAVELLKGHDIASALTFSAIWGLITSAVYTGASIYRWRKQQACAICGDTPEPK